LAFWREYGNQCTAAAATIEKDGMAAVTVTRTNEDGGQTIQDTDLSFINNNDGNKTQQLLENKLELSILAVIGLQDNRYLKKALRKEKVARQAVPAEADTNGSSSTKSASSTTSASLSTSTASTSSTPPQISLDVTIQLPAHEHDTEDTTMLSFNTKPSTLDNTTTTNSTYEFGDVPQYFAIERGTSRYAKSLRRKMNRKKILLHVLYTPNTKKPTFFLRGNSQTDSTTEVKLGTVSLDLKEFVTGTFVAGDFPMYDSIQTNEVVRVWCGLR